jgi:hypothetical protein
MDLRAFDLKNFKHVMAAIANFLGEVRIGVDQETERREELDSC